MWWIKYCEILSELTEVLELGDNYIWYVDAGSKYLEVFEVFDETDGSVFDYVCADREELNALLKLF